MDGGDALQSLFGGRKEAGTGCVIRACLLCADRFGEVGIDIAKGAKQALSVADSQTRGLLRRRRETGTATLQDAAGLSSDRLSHQRLAA